ncbi:ribonuclease HI family protein [Sinomonas susongensis]|uniref:ribonuclease HI family protein n=1 Tax=Sinomonas susongensis TaxID=1324851 RepID=UPI001109D6E3|nr:ribonuclease HI family protein [Sinomonas susongensis]
MTITAAADGSALGNPGPAGWAWYIDENRWHAGGWPHGTNNQGELMAVLDLFRSTAHVPHEPLRILCDSQYVINCVTKWMPNWKRRGWKKADGKPVLNVDLLRQIDEELAGRTYTFEWVKGHAGHALNEAADERARACATAFQAGAAPVVGPGFDGSLPRELPAAAPRAVPEPPAQAPEPVQDDLFGVEVPGAEPREVEAVVELEQELLDPETRSDFGQLAYLLHPEYREIGQSGRLWVRDEVVDALVQDPELSVSFELVEASALSPDLIQVLYRTASAEGSALRSSLWQRADGRWRLRFHQGTPEA